MREIPQELAQELAGAVSGYLNCEKCRALGIAHDGLRVVGDKLDALEQPPDPAEVAAKKIITRMARAGTDGNTPHTVMSAIIRQAYAERDETVKALSDYMKTQFHSAVRVNGTVELVPGFDADLLNKTLRKLFGWRK